MRGTSDNADISVRRSVLSGPTRDLPELAGLTAAAVLCYFMERQRQWKFNTD